MTTKTRLGARLPLMGAVRTRSKLEAALAYAKFGVPTFPCRSVGDGGECSCGDPGCRHPGKHPAAPPEELRFTDKPALIKRYWDRWPAANIATPLGKPFGHFVVDVDRRPWRPFVARLIEDFGLPRPAAVAVSGRGGAHLHYAYPPGQWVEHLTKDAVPHWRAYDGDPRRAPYVPEDLSEEVPCGDLWGKHAGVSLLGDRPRLDRGSAVAFRWALLPPSTTVGAYEWVSSRELAGFPWRGEENHPRPSRRERRRRGRASAKTRLGEPI